MLLVIHLFLCQSPGQVKVSGLLAGSCRHRPCPVRLYRGIRRVEVLQRVVTGNEVGARMLR